MRVDRAVATAIVEAVSSHAIEAAIHAAERLALRDADLKVAATRELEEARYEATLAARRYECVDPAKRLVARELEARWNSALERVAEIEARLRALDEAAAQRPSIDRTGLLSLAHDLPRVWNSTDTDAGAKQRLTRILIQEVVIDLDDKSNEAIVTVHWTGGRHTELRVVRTKTKRSSDNQRPAAVEVMRKLGGRYPDQRLAVTMNRMRCKTVDGKSWTMVRVREWRERLGIAAFDPQNNRTETISVDETARRLKICMGSVRRLIKEGILPARQVMKSAPWEVPVAALTTEAVQIGVRNVIARRPINYPTLQEITSLKLPGF
jgi:hypothetical protein